MCKGGGQPSDTGKIWVPDANGEAQPFVVEGCLRRKLDSVHLVRVQEEHEHMFGGLEDKMIWLEVDWERRQDHVSGVSLFTRCD